MKLKTFVFALTLLTCAPLCFAQKAKDKEPPPPLTREDEEEQFRRFAIQVPDSGGASVPAILTGALRPAELPREKDSWWCRSSRAAASRGAERAT